MTEFEIRKVILHLSTDRYWEGTDLPITRKEPLYLVIVNGQRVDSFMYYKNAQRKIRQLKE